MAGEAAATGSGNGSFGWLIDMIQHIVSQQSGGSGTPPVVVPPTSAEAPKSAKAEPKQSATPQQQTAPAAQPNQQQVAQVAPLANIMPGTINATMPPIMQMQPLSTAAPALPSHDSGSGKVSGTDAMGTIIKAGTALLGLIGL